MTKRDVENVCGARDEGSRVELGPGRKAGSRQTTMAFLGVGFMCEHTRRGLSKVSNGCNKTIAFFHTRSQRGVRGNAFDLLSVCLSVADYPLDMSAPPDIVQINLFSYYLLSLNLQLIQQ